mmetsp:Transcript_37421/g.62041  ORF Transcript_37421/g.62041 Transcript_37421/m.62041 type:complete len:548 (-) Transcript_37421:46-1689(-)
MNRAGVLRNAMARRCGSQALLASVFLLSVTSIHLYFFGDSIYSFFFPTEFPSLPLMPSSDIASLKTHPGIAGANPSLIAKGDPLWKERTRYVAFEDPETSPLFIDAFLDPRPRMPYEYWFANVTELAPLIRITLLGVSNPPVPVFSSNLTHDTMYWCRIWSWKEKPPNIVHLPLKYHAYGNGLVHDRFMPQYFDQGLFFCEINATYAYRTDLLVSIVSDQDRILKWQNEIKGEVQMVNSMPVRVLAAREPERSLCMCLSHLWGNSSQEFVEWMEYNLMLGAEHLDAYFIPSLVGPLLKNALDYYVGLGTLTLHPRVLPTVGNRTIAYKGQITNNNHCLYSRMFNCKRLMFMDVDEFLVPAQPNDRSFVDMFLRLEPNVNWRFRPYIFPRNCQEPKQKGHAPKLITQANKLKFIPGFKRPRMNEIKCIIRPDYVDEYWVHGVYWHFFLPVRWPVPPETVDYYLLQSDQIVPNDIASYYHYRDVCRLWGCCPDAVKYVPSLKNAKITKDTCCPEGSLEGEERLIDWWGPELQKRVSRTHSLLVKRLRPD